MDSEPAPGSTPYDTARAHGRAARRTAALDTASELLERHGPGALTMRRIATELGCSTTVLYTIFGGKSGIAEQLWLEGFDRLDRAVRSVHEPDPLARLTGMGQAYRANALSNRAYYAVMFQRAIPGFEPSAQAYAASLRPLHALAGAVEECIGAGVFAPADPMHIARVLWAASHGAVSLEIVGYEGAIDAEERYECLMRAAAAWFMAGGGG
ncbi:transcriptional regulator, TetR family [Haloechinothrix alba]|uniref:Transcriptional regulator, TetR family n=1 Tax=Haloechinothrix alba TaxID=664784 RepID=A0A238X9U8_9PSEU|nr:TetR/AcrR family transcriptional regulator [Haloechinothrix alba]SNR55124.1 transcriptional regulator, TetR family [Haloechinothrix alba]